MHEIVSKVLNILGITNSEFEIVTDRKRFEEVLLGMLKSGRIDEADFKYMLGVTELPDAELTVFDGSKSYVYLGSEARSDVFALLHALGHVYLVQKLHLSFSSKLNVYAVGSCRDFDIKTYVFLVDQFRNMFEDSLADATIYSVLLEVDHSVAEEYWKYATSEIEKAVKIVTDALVKMIPSFSDLYTYATMFAESIYKHRSGLTRKTTKKFHSYIKNRSRRVALEFFDAVVEEMAKATGYEVSKRIVDDGPLTKYEMIIGVTMVCIPIGTIQ